MGAFDDLTGQPFGRLTVMKRAANHGKKIMWWCYCDPERGGCGVIVPVSATGLRYGETRSCGCLRREVTAERKRTHGLSRDLDACPEYRHWLAMRQRCLNPNDSGYFRYGGRGITICEEWDDFAVFLRDMGPRPSPKHSVERKDVNGPYAPWNCVWATQREQTANTRRNIYVTYQGERLHLSEAARRAGVRPRLAHARLTVLGWPEEDLFIPPDLHRPKRRRQA